MEDLTETELRIPYMKRERAYHPIDCEENQEVTWHFDITAADLRQLEFQYSHAADALRHLKDQQARVPIEIVDLSFLSTLLMDENVNELFEAIADLPSLREIHVYSPFEIVNHGPGRKLFALQWKGITSMIEHSSEKLTAVTLDINLLLAYDEMRYLPSWTERHRGLKKIVFGAGIMVHHASLTSLSAWLCQFPLLERVDLPSVSTMREPEDTEQERQLPPFALYDFVICRQKQMHLVELTVPMNDSLIMMRNMTGMVHRNRVLKKLTVHGRLMVDEGYTLMDQDRLSLNILLRPDSPIEELTLILFHTSALGEREFVDCVPHATVLQHNTTLIRLSFRTNMPGHAHHYAPADAFNTLLKEHNSTLKYLDYDGKCLSADTDFYLKLNRHDLRCLIGKSAQYPILPNPLCTLFEHSNDHRIVFCVLSQYAEVLVSVVSGLLTSPSRKRAKAGV